MKILSHRGYWKVDEEKNTEIAFKRSFSLGFGTETDIRDFGGRLVISHDIATGAEISFEDFLALANSSKVSEPMTLALNVKADGLASHVARALMDFAGLDCFVFDMSVPDMRAYFDRGIPVFTRMSEVEHQPAWLDRSAGVWLDGFESEWFSNSLILDLLGKQKCVCIVSPELHRRSYLALWKRIKPLADEPRLMLCTDAPEQALEFFLND
jgi:hypothetical protein